MTKKSELRVVGISHSPLMEFTSQPLPRAPQAPTFRAAATATGRELEAFDPELVVIFGPDHFSSFYYNAMPPFCVGVRAEGEGDFDSPRGPMPTDEALSLSCVRALYDAGFDPAVSYRMRLDHGYTLPLLYLFGSIDKIPVLPIFINGAAPPLASFARTFKFGEAVGRWLGGLGKRVLIIGSGGLSHDPPIGRIADAPPPVADFLINGGAIPYEGRMAMEPSIADACRDGIAGKLPIHPLNPDWDRWTLDCFTKGDLASIAALKDDEVTRTAGNSAHEVRCWLAAYAALAVNGPYKSKVNFYEPIQEWMVGTALAEARAA